MLTDLSEESLAKTFLTIIVTKTPHPREPFFFGVIFLLKFSSFFIFYKVADFVSFSLLSSLLTFHLKTPSARIRRGRNLRDTTSVCLVLTGKAFVSAKRIYTPTP